MSGLIETRVTSNALDKALSNLAHALADTRTLTAGIAAELLDLTEEAFDEEGPGWASLSSATIAQREKEGTWPGKILQRRGELAASVQTDSGNNYASLGSNKVYAAIHQLGGQAGRNHSVEIEAREYLPVDSDGNLTPHAERAVLDNVLDYLARKTRQ